MRYGEKIRWKDLRKSVYVDVTILNRKAWAIKEYVSVIENLVNTEIK